MVGRYCLRSEASAFLLPMLTAVSMAFASRPCFRATMLTDPFRPLSELMGGRLAEAFFSVAEYIQCERFPLSNLSADRGWYGCFRSASNDSVS